jgi:hypothetical protein
VAPLAVAEEVAEAPSRREEATTPIALPAVRMLVPSEPRASSTPPPTVDAGSRTRDTLPVPGRGRASRPASPELRSRTWLPSVAIGGGLVVAAALGVKALTTPSAPASGGPPAPLVAPSGIASGPASAATAIAAASGGVEVRAALDARPARTNPATSGAASTAPAAARPPAATSSLLTASAASPAPPTAPSAAGLATGPGPPSAAGTAPPADAGAVRSLLDEIPLEDDATIVAAVARRHHPALSRACWEGSSQTALVHATVLVDPGGTVTSAHVSGQDARLAQCVEGDVRTWRYPPSIKPRTLTFPILFRRR